MHRTCALGIYNKTVIIVGYGNLSSPAVFYCYDSQCPNCYAETNMVNNKLMPVGLQLIIYFTSTIFENEYIVRLAPTTSTSIR